MQTPARSRLATVVVAITALAAPACMLDLRPLAPSIDAELEDAVSRGFDGIIVYVDQPGGSSLHSAGYVGTNVTGGLFTHARRSENPYPGFDKSGLFAKVGFNVSCQFQVGHRF